MRRTCIAVALTLSLSRVGLSQGTPDARYVRALGTLYTTSQLGGLVKEWCDARAPETRASTDTALAAWKSAFHLDDVEARATAVLGSQLPSLQAGVASRRAAVFRALDKDSKAPEADCRQMLPYLNRSANPQRLNPAEFALVAAERTRSTTTASAPVAMTGTAAQAPASLDTPSGTTPRGAAQGGTAPTVRGGGTVHTVAQLSAFIARDTRTARARLKQLGQVTVQGTLETYDEQRADSRVWLNTISDGWRSTTSVLCYDMSFRALYDAGRRVITLRGTVRDYDNWIQLENCRVVSDVAALTPSALSDSSGLRRISARPEQIRTAPNGGLTMTQIEGVFQPTKLRYNPMSMLFEPDETTYLVLKDGWLYDNLGVSPHDLNVAESRRLEPQHWHRWRKRGDLLEMQTFDEYGRTDGAWSTLEVIARPAIGARRLNGVFSATSSATAGVPGMGGALSVGRTSYTFQPDGAFSWTNFTQNFASSSTGTGPGGSTIVVGGATVGPGGTSISAVGSSDDAGRYTTDGYTLELRTRSGKVFRFPIFSWDSGKYRDYLVINGTTYSPPK